jgi:drug/metabolite transporter (DMT)-like permease
LCVIAGGNVVAIRYLVNRQRLDPLWTAASRFMVATAIFAVIALSLRVSFPRGRSLVGAVLYGALGFGGFFGFGYWGLEDAPAAVGGVMLATVPLLTFLLALAHRLERFRWSGLLGSALVVGGTAVILRDGLESDVPIASALAILAAAACAAEAALVVKAFPPVHPAMMNAIGMGVGTAIFLVLTVVFNESYALPETGAAWASQVYLVIPGSVGVFLLYLYVLRKWTASAASYEFVIIPLVGIVLAAWLLDEPITGAFAAGAVLVLAGVYLGALRQSAGKEAVIDSDVVEPGRRNAGTASPKLIGRP